MTTERLAQLEKDPFYKKFILSIRIDERQRIREAMEKLDRFKGDCPNYYHSILALLNS